MWRWIALTFIVAPLTLLAPITNRNPAAQQPTNTVTRTDISVGATAVQLCPVNGARIDCSCTNNDGAAAIRVGDANISTTRGQRVTGGGTFRASTTSAVFGIAEAGNVAMSCTDQTR